MGSRAPGKVGVPRSVHVILQLPTSCRPLNVDVAGIEPAVHGHLIYSQAASPDASRPCATSSAAL